MEKIRRFPNAYYSWQIKLFCQIVLYADHDPKIPAATHSLTSFELGIAVKHYLYQVLEYYKNGKYFKIISNVKILSY